MPNFESNADFERWLNTQPHDICGAIATRAALRVFPIEVYGASGTLVLLIARVILTSGVAANSPTPEVRAAVETATRAASATRAAALADSRATDPGTLNAAGAALAAARATNTATRAADAARAAAKAARVATRAVRNTDAGNKAAADAATHATDAAAYADSDFSLQEMLHAQLWDQPREPDWLVEALMTLGNILEGSPEWEFWRRWYRGFLIGQPLDWDLQRQVALIAEEDWEKGPEHIAEEIQRIEDGYWANALPQAETIIKDEVTGRYEVLSSTFDRDAELERWLTQIDFAVNLAVESNSSDFNRMCTAFKYIEHALEHCRDDPNAIEQQIGVARGIIETNCAKPDYQSDDSLGALAVVLEQIQIQMRADHPEVRKAWEKRIAQKLREVDRDTKLKAAETIRAETDRSQTRLAIEMELDAEAVETSESVEAQAIAIRRAGGRAAKMNVMDRASKAVGNVESSTGYRAIRIGNTGYKVGDIVWMLKDLLGF